MKLPNPIELDGRVGEGGGQVVRIAIALSAVTGTAVKITNVRGNRGSGGARGGGETPPPFRCLDLGGISANQGCVQD
jgi:hypothetical protein